jgi:hypothetical protein
MRSPKIKKVYPSKHLGIIPSHAETTIEKYKKKE